jgi:16S rRNA (adenine1518-N6/adenine1519-N6)-dimethyltransferase
MAAKPGSKDYSSFSVLCASSYRVTPLAVLKGASFYPEPRVDSQGVRLDFIPGKVYPECFFPLVRSLFASRRKTVKNNLKTFAAGRLLSAAPAASFSRTGSGTALSVQELSEEALALAGIKGEERAERFGVEEFRALACAVEKLLQAGEHHEAGRVSASNIIPIRKRSGAHGR